MFIEKVERFARAFDLHDEDDVKMYQDILSDPSVRIRERRFAKQSESESQGSGQDLQTTESTTMYIYVEYERCNL
jgi:hypothetical protein